MSNIGFIGLGLMGGAMVGRLQDKDHSLTVLANKSRENVDLAVKRGASEVQTARELANVSDIVMLCMGTSEQVESRMNGPDGVITGLRSEAIVIDFGTSLPASTRALAETVAKAGGYYLDAPLGRTPAHAADGLLNIMCAGNADAYARVKTVLQDLGENVFHLGQSGSGHTAKLINNFFAMTTANAMAEAFAMADKQGLDRQSLYDVMSAGPLHSGMMDFIKGYSIDGDPAQLAFAIKNAAKDVGYYKTMAQDSGVDSIMSKCALNALSAAVEDGRGDDMVAQMLDFYNARFGN